MSYNKDDVPADDIIITKDLQENEFWSEDKYFSIEGK